VDPPERRPDRLVIRRPARGRRVIVQPRREVVDAANRLVDVEQLDLVGARLHPLDVVEDLVKA
jgi:hypothetical protein